MKYRAGLAPKRKSVQRRSEYQKMFVWRKPETKATPVLAANKVSNINMYMPTCSLMSFSPRYNVLV